MLLNNVSFSLEFYSHLQQIISVARSQDLLSNLVALIVNYNNFSILGSVF